MKVDVAALRALAEAGTAYWQAARALGVSRQYVRTTAIQCGIAFRGEVTREDRAAWGAAGARVTARARARHVVPLAERRVEALRAACERAGVAT